MHEDAPTPAATTGHEAASTQDAASVPHGEIVARALEWYDANARDLPWRRPDCTPWGVMVSEFMLQQTPVNRVLGPWHEWMRRWPTPAALASEPPAEAVRAWGRLGYPRRAQRLHAAATMITEQHGGEVPADLDQLRALPGVGEYTAAAIASFAHGRRAVVVDTNVRRLLTRVCFPADVDPAALLPDDDATAAHWAAASMELGALVCTARNPRCEECPLADTCGWLAADRPEPTTPLTRPQAWHGTDRQCRGVLLQHLRTHPLASADTLTALWPDDREQAERCLASLLADGLVNETSDGFTL